MESFGEQARAALKERGLSIRSASRELSFNHAYLSRVLNGAQTPSPAFVKALDRLVCADGALIAAAASEAAPRRGRKRAASSHGDDGSVDLMRRSVLAGGLGVLTLPALGLDELRHIATAITNAQRYADKDVVGYCQKQLKNCAEMDGTDGPKQSLPTILGLIASIEKMAIEAKSEVRRELLRVGAQTAEFAGWLYRDIGLAEPANYWRDRAIEWAQVSGDSTMQGYVLLKKSQAVWDERDALRMLTLAEAVREGPWQLPSRVQAEAAQQEARGHAMLDGDISLMEAKLNEARSLLVFDENSQKSPVAAHYDEALFAVQIAMCYSEAGQADRALEIYNRWLSEDTFSRRDYAYFLVLKGSAHARAGQPDEAANAGLHAVSLARDTNSIRSIREAVRLARNLNRWQTRDSVHELRDSLLVV